MADTSIQTLLDAFTKWREEVVRLSTKVVRVLRSGDTDRINGRSLDDLKAIIQQEVDDHEALKNPHVLTPAQVAGVSRALWDTYMGNKMRKSEFPISEFKEASMASVVVSEDSVRINNGVYEIRGWRFIVSQPVILERESGMTPLYIKARLVLDTDEPKFIKATNEVYLSDSPVETTDDVVLGEVVDEVFVKAPYLRFDNSRIRLTPRGSSTPASDATQNTTGSVSNAWF